MSSYYETSIQVFSSRRRKVVTFCRVTLLSLRRFRAIISIGDTLFQSTNVKRAGDKG